MQIQHEKLDDLFQDASAEAHQHQTDSRESIIRLSRRRLRTNNDDTAARYVLAAYHLQQDRPEDALSLLVDDCEGSTVTAMGNRLAGYAHVIRHNIEAARVHFDKAVRLDPTRVDCWNMLGKIHEQIGQDELAITFYQRAVVFDDSDHESAVSLSRIYVKTRKLTDAIDTLRISLMRDQRSVRLNLALGALLERRAAILRRTRRSRARERALREAENCYATAAAASPSARTYLALGLIQKRREQFDAARNSFEKALQISPNDAGVITQIANDWVDRGEIDQAKTLYEKSLRIKSDRAVTHFRFTRVQKFKASDETDQYVKELVTQLSHSAMPRQARTYLHFALAKVLDDSGQYDRAWQHYDQANRLKRGHSENRRERNAPARTSIGQLASDTVRFFDTDFFQSNRHVGSPETTPLFIVGMPRSGTTLTEQILSSHPSVAGAGELKDIEQIRQRLTYEQRIRNSSIGTTIETRYPGLLSTSDDVRLRELAGQYLDNLDSVRTTERHVTDKMPTNFLHLGLIALMFPRATVIHCRRNPMDVMVSCYCQNLASPFCDLEQLVLYHRAYQRMMSHWERVLPMKIHTVDYEKLVSDPESQTRALLDHCGLAWDDRCLNFHANARSVHTPSKWQVRQPMYSTSVERWRRFEPHLKEIAKQVAID